MLKVDVNDKKNHLASDRIALGTAISNLLKGVLISLEKISKFKKQCFIMEKEECILNFDALFDALCKKMKN